MAVRIEILALCLALVFAPSVARSQTLNESPPPAVPHEPLVIRSYTRLVQLSVVVEHKPGLPINDLKKEDFEVYDEGKEQSIAYFSAEKPAPVVSRPLPPNAFTNRFDLKGEDPGSVTVVLFDALNTDGTDQIRVRSQVLRFLQTLKPQDHVAIYALTTKLLMLHDFTQDAEALVAATKNFLPRQSALFDASHPEQVDFSKLGGDPQLWANFQQHMDAANQQIAWQAVVDRAERTASALAEIAQHVYGIPGRKSLVWVSGGFPLQLINQVIGNPSVDDVSAARNINDAVEALNRTNLAIYAVDAHGVEINPGMGVDSRSYRSTEDAQAFFTRQDTRDSLRSLADATGGAAFYGSNDVRDAMRRAFDDGRFAYTIGFYPDHRHWDGKYHHIKIRVLSGRGHLRYRRGYFASQETSNTREKASAALHDAILSPLDATNLGIVIRASRLSNHSLQLQISLDPKQFLWQESGDRLTDTLDLLYTQRESSGMILRAESQHVELNFNHEQYQRLVQTGLTLQQTIPMESLATELRVAARDAGPATVGSVTIPLKSLTASDATDSPQLPGPLKVRP
jgi:VWFA-related protein